MSRTVVAIVVAVCAVGLAVLAAAVWRQVDAGTPIQAKAPGVWQERTEVDPVRLTVSAGGGDSGTTRFWVKYPGASATPFPARLEGDSIVVSDEATGEVVWTISYDEGADALLVTRPATGERHVLRRVSR